MGTKKPIWQSDNEVKAVKGTSKIKDPTVLAEIALYAPYESVRNLAATLQARYAKKANRSVVPSTKRCPKCKAGLVDAEYYTAIRGATSLVSQEQKTNWQEMKKTTTTVTSTKYSDVQRHTGTICMCCSEKRAYYTKIFGRILLAIALLGVIISLILLLSTESDIWMFIGLPFLGALIFGWKLSTSEKYVNATHMSKEAMEKSEPEDWLDTDGARDYVSWRFVLKYPAKNIPKGRVLLTRSGARNMK